MVPLRVLLLLFLTAASTGLKLIHVESAESVRLQCRGPKDGNITVLEWKRHDVLADGYVFFYRDGRPRESFQHPHFKGRVELSDPQMKNGDMSIILHNTTINDTGTYECHIIMGNARHRNRRTSEIKHRINLRVVAPPGPTGGTTEDGGKEDGRKEDGALKLIGGLFLLCFLFLLFYVVFGFFSFFHLQKTKEKLNQNSNRRTVSLLLLFRTNTDCYTSVQG